MTQCNNTADWIIYLSNNPSDYTYWRWKTYSCYDHIKYMLSDDSEEVTLHRVHDNEIPCGYSGYNLSKKIRKR